MRVLFVSLGFPPAVAWGGPVRVVYENALELQRRGYEVGVCTSNLLDKGRRLAQDCIVKDVDGISVQYLQMYSIPDWPGTLGPTIMGPRASLRLWNQVGEADIVHVNGVRNAIALYAILFAHWRDKALVIQPHGTLPHIVNSIWFKRLFDLLLMKYLLTSAQVLMALQEVEKRQIVAAGGSSDLIEVVPNGMSFKDYEGSDYRGRFRQQYRISGEERIILFIGRINHKKGTDLLVKSFAHLLNSGMDAVRLVIAGPDDGQLDEVNSLIAHYGLDDKVLLTGLLTEDEVWTAYEDADVFVLPCRVDTFPMAIIEAARSGTPMVVTETCEMSDLVSGKAAEVVTTDVETIAQAIRKLLSDEQLRERYSVGARHLMETTFSIQAVGDRLEAIYQKALDRRARI